MVSDFLVQHRSGHYYLNKNLSQVFFLTTFLLEIIIGVEHVARSATASVNVGLDAYSDNLTTLEQVEKLFMLLDFKEEYKRPFDRNRS
jgi:hypothetical protein